MSTSAESTLRVLVADSDRGSRLLLVRALRAGRYRTAEVADALGVLDAMRGILQGNAEDTFDVIVSEARMPGYSGLDVLAALRAVRAERPRVIILTERRDEQSRRRAEELGAAAALGRPVPMDVIVSAIRRAAGLPPETPEPGDGSG